MADAIVELVERRGGRAWHARDSRRQNLTDLPDLILILPWCRTIAFVELKGQRREITDGQRRALDMIGDCDRVLSCVVRPNPKIGESSYDTLLDWLKGEAA